MTDRPKSDMDLSSERVWDSFAAPLRRFIRKRVDNEADADDVLQTVFTKVHARLPQLETADKIAPWIYQIARHAIIDHHRGRASAAQTVELPDDIPEQAEPPAVLHELAECVGPLIELLPEPYRHALQVTELEGLPQRELAAQLGLSLSGAKSRVQRGREQLKTLLLECCHVEFDRRGGLLSYEPRVKACPRCASARHT